MTTTNRTEKGDLFPIHSIHTHAGSHRPAERDSLSLHQALTELVRPALAKKATEEDITEFHRINAAFCSSWVEMGEEIKNGEEGPDMAAPGEEEQEQGRKGIPSLLSSREENIASNITQVSRFLFSQNKTKQN